MVHHDSVPTLIYGRVVSSPYLYDFMFEPFCSYDFTFHEPCVNMLGFYVLLEVYA